MRELGLVGRLEESRVLRDCLARSTSVVLAGVSGVGKTCLARDVIAEFAAGRPNHWLSATRSSQLIPLGVLGPLLPLDRGEVVVSGNAFEIAQEVRRAVAEETSSTAPLLTVDDAHLVDDLSAMVLHQLVVSGAAVVLATVRTGETTPDAVTALWKDGWAERVELQPLSRAETDELVMSLLQGICGPLELHAVWEASQGSPLYIHELIRASQEVGALVREGGRWRLQGALPVGGRLIELIKLRIDGLPEDSRNDLDVIALAEPVPIEVIDGWTSAGGLTQAEKSGLLAIASEGGQVVARLTHPVFGEVLRSLMPATRRRQLAARLADGYTEAGLRDRADLLRCVTWRLESGEIGSPEMLMSGAREAIELLDYRLAERLARAARSAQPGDLHATLILAEALYRQRRYEAVTAELGQFDPSDDPGRAEVAIMKAKALWFGLHATGAAETALAAAEAAVTSAASRNALAAYRAKLRAALGFPAEALSLAAKVADDPSQEPVVTLTALGAVATASAFCGRVGDALAAASRWREPLLAAVSRSHELSDWGATGAWVAVFLAGDTRRARSMGRSFLDLGLQRHDAQFVAAGSVALGWVALLEGDVSAAVPHLREGWDVLRSADWAGVVILAGAGLALALAFSGDTVAARSIASETDATRRQGLNWFDPLLVTAAAWVEAAEGQISSSIATLRDVADSARQRSQFPYEAHALHGMARLGAAAEVAGRLAALAEVIEGPFAPAAASHAAAMAASDPSHLEAAAAEWDKLGFHLLAAEAAATAARRCQALGRRSRVLALGQRCETLLAACPGAVSPVVAALRSPSVLTLRELEVARMAARGSSSRRIAGQLGISVRTVETHLDHIYTKLGVAGRQDLAQALGGTSGSSPNRAT